MKFIKDLRENYRNGVSLDSLCKDYSRWVKKCEYLVFKKEVTYEDIDSNEKDSFACFKMIKRGNDVYCYRVFKRFSDLMDLCRLKNDIVFINDKRQRYAFSPFLFITLTYDRRIGSFDNAWHNIGNDLNLFFAKMKNIYGRFKVLRCFESYSKDGYPHIHILMLFENKVFQVKRHYYTTKKGNLANKYILDDSDKNKISGFWHSFVDVTAVKTLFSVRYLLKYITKEMYSSNDGLTSVCMLLFNKRSYSISRDFTAVLGNYLDSVTVRLDPNTHNSNFNLNDFHYVGGFIAPFPMDKWFYFFKSDNFNDIFKIEDSRLNCTVGGELIGV